MNKYFLTGTLVIIIFLLYNIFLVFTSLEGVPKSVTNNPPFPYLTEKPITEDGYYMLTVAWNIAEGKGFTYNYGIKTTGVQPLATLLYSVPAYLVQNFGGDKYDLARAIIILSALLQIIFAFLVYRMAVSISKDPDKGLYFLISVCVVLLNFKVLLNFANGLETGLYIILLGLFFLYWLKYNSLQTGLLHVLGLGILSGLILLARLDSGIIILTFYLIMLITKRISVKQSVMIFIIAFLIFLPWQIYVWEVTGNLLQSSARSQTTSFLFNDLTYKIEQYSVSIIHNFTPFLYTGNIKWIMFSIGLFYIALMVNYFIRNKIYHLYIINKEIVFFMSLSFLLITIVYLIFSTAPYFYFRYLAIWMILTFPIIVIMFSKILVRYKTIYKAAAFFIVLIFFSAQVILYLHSGKSARAFPVRVEFVKNNFNKDIRVAAFQTGVLGYYHSNTLNLDGKMDNNSLVSSSRQDIESYIDKMQIDVVMEWKDFMLIVLKKDYLDKYWYLYSGDIGDGRTICYVRKYRSEIKKTN